MLSGEDQIRHIGGKVGVGELTLARAKAGEVEAQHRHAVLGQLLRDAARGEDVFAAGEAMGEQGIRARRLVRRVEARRELLPLGAQERDAFDFHPALCNASHTRRGVAGMSRCCTPRGRSASRIAFITAGGAPTQPASPTPLTPSGLVFAGTSMNSSS